MDDKELKPICPYCRKEWTPKMETILYTSQGCDTCGYGSEVYGTIEIYCEGCNKLIYRKDI